MNALSPMFLCMTLKTYGFQHLWPIIRLIELSFSRLHSVFVMRVELRCFSTSFTTPFCSFQCFPSVGHIDRSFTVSVPGVLERREYKLLNFLLLQIGVRPMPFPRWSIMNQFRMHRPFSPQPSSFRILGSKFSIASFWPIPMPHVLFPDLIRANTILLLQPSSESHPDVPVKLVKNSTGVDCSIVAGPSSYQRIDCFQLVQVIIIEGLFLGHFLNLLLRPLQTLLCRLHEDADDIAIRRFVTAEDVIAQEFEAVNDVSNDGFLFA